MTDTAPLSKVDSANHDNFVKATAEEVKKGHRRASSMAADVYSIEDLGEFADFSPSEGSFGRGRWG
jgi:hypothetical protein